MASDMVLSALTWYRSTMSQFAPLWKRLLFPFLIVVLLLILRLILDTPPVRRFGRLKPSLTAPLLLPFRLRYLEQIALRPSSLLRCPLHLAPIQHWLARVLREHGNERAMVIERERLPFCVFPGRDQTRHRFGRWRTPGVRRPLQVVQDVRVHLLVMPPPHAFHLPHQRVQLSTRLPLRADGQPARTAPALDGERGPLRIAPAACAVCACVARSIHAFDETCEGVRARGAPEGEHEEVEDVREGLEIVGKCEGAAWVLKGHSGAEKPGSL